MVQGLEAGVGREDGEIGSRQHGSTILSAETVREALADPAWEVAMLHSDTCAGKRLGGEVVWTKPGKAAVVHDFRVGKSGAGIAKLDI